MSVAAAASMRSFAVAPARQAERSNRAFRDYGRHALVCESHANAGGAHQLSAERAHLSGPVALITGERERQTDHDVDDVVLRDEVATRLNGWPLAGPRVSTVSG
jgi:hypothetical protein